MVLRDATDALRAPFIGAKLLLENRYLWAPAALPVFLGLIWSLLSLGLAAATSAAGPLWLLALTFALAAGLILAIVFVHLMLALCAPLFDWLSERSERVISPQSMDDTTENWTARTLRATGVGLRLFLLKLVLLLVVVVVSFMPPIGPLLAMLLIGFTLSVDFIDYPMTRRRWSAAHKRAWLGRHWAAVVSFSALIYLLLILPGVGGLLLAPSIIGGTWLVCTRDATHFAQNNDATYVEAPPSPPG